MKIKIKANIKPALAHAEGIQKPSTTPRLMKIKIAHQTPGGACRKRRKAVEPALAHTEGNPKHQHPEA
jgi:hypothetical protein